MRTPWRTYHQALCFVAAFAAGVSAWAHHSPNETIEALSLAIEHGGATPRLLVQRAYEYRALGDGASARRDLEDALLLNPAYVGALKSLARLDVIEGAPGAAIPRLRACLAVDLDVNAAGPIHALWADALEAEGALEGALAQCRMALDAANPDIDWFLQEGRLLRALGRTDDAVMAFESATARNPSAVLHRAWLEALIDAGRLDRAAEAIETELAASRWKSGWLVLRARVFEAAGNSFAAHRDARMALREIEERLDPAYPDPFLLVDGGTALAVLGDAERAMARLDQARALGTPKALTLRLEERLARGANERRAAAQ